MGEILECVLFSGWKLKKSREFTSEKIQLP